jgi:hypothetical protein
MTRPRDCGEAFLTVQEYASIFRVHVQTVYSAIRYRRFKYEVIRPTGRSIRIIVPRGSIPNIEPLTNAE